MTWQFGMLPCCKPPEAEGRLGGDLKGGTMVCVGETNEGALVSRLLGIG